MPGIKFVKQDYANHDAPEKLIAYISNKATIFSGMAIDPDYAAERMHLVKNAYYKYDGIQMIHFILTFDKTESSYVDDNELVMYAQEICRYLSKNFQIVYGIHHHDERVHIHFAMNSVSYLDGSKYANSYQNHEYLREIVKYITGSRNVEIWYN